MKPALQLKLSQHLALTPQLQQSIKLLQLSTVEMQQEIERYLLENPLLEREEEGEAGYSSSAGEASDRPTPSSENRESDGEREREREERDESASEMPDYQGDDDRWTSDAGTYSGAGRDEDDDSDSQDIHAAVTSLREHSGLAVGADPVV